MTTQSIIVEGMTCKHCEAGVAKALQTVQGVAAVRVSLADGRAEVDSVTGIDPALLTAAVEKKGYRARAAE
jgi:copper chaperone